MSTSDVSTNTKHELRRNYNKTSETKSNIEGDLGYVFYDKRANIVDVKNTSKVPIYTENNVYSSALHKDCLRNAKRCMMEDPFTKLLLKVLKSKGCEFIPERHLSCETCKSVTSGGFDVNFKQIALCENNVNTYKLACKGLRHELIHAFDYCRAKVNFLSDLRHIACTEIRAANFCHCSFIKSSVGGIIPLFSVKNMQQFCIKEKAAISLHTVRNITREEADNVVDEVFNDCVADLEPFGRKIKYRNFNDDSKRAYFEARYYGYYNDDSD